MTTMKFFKYAFASCAMMALTACDMDINDDPNAISEASNDNIFPTAEMNLAATIGVDFNIYGGYNAEMYSQNSGSSNYLDYSRFDVTSTNSSLAYSQLYARVLQQLEIVRQQSLNEPGTYLAATTLRAYAFQALVDAYGETPYTEALGVQTQPKYDDGDEVYAGIIAELEAAKAAASPQAAVCANLLFGKTTAAAGKAEDWLPFANSLLLKLYMRESGVVDVKDKVDALVAENNFIAEDIVFDKCWGNAVGSYSPLFTEQKVVATDIVINYAVSATVRAEGVNDQRLAANWKEGTKGMIGTVSGTNLSSELPTATDADFVQPAYRFDMPVYLMTKAEVCFFLAEYYARLNVNMAKAKNCYLQALKASCETAGVKDVSADIASGAYPFEDNPMRAIGVQKWIHLTSTLQGFEGWCELRRIGYPAFSDQTADELIGTDIASYNLLPQTYEPATLYTPKGVYNKVGAKKLRQRFDYAASSTQYNNNVPATKDPTVPVFWNNK